MVVDVGLARRTLAVVTFLGINGHELEATDADVVTAIVAVADRRLSEHALARWIRRHVV